ncbi:MarR family winged helix-turn-helix transcriptional regulator [Luteococcus sp. Sow4_B9]|uniref:MarR family winged helix-turn-helix transcriptional regulator n=1 Tax=Luteococcus sp. Sow4_B9 TaxID=3438792 RepID=UPI003F975865
MADPDDSLWLNDEQQRIWRKWLLATARVDYYLDQDLRRHGLDLAEYEILVVLSESENRRCRMSELAELVHQSRSRLTHAVSRMEKSGWVERCAAPDDRRGVMAILTDRGYKLLEEAAPNHVAAVRRILVDAADPEDFKAMGRVMEAILSVED